jgi:ABC-type branched-subunit amino acid transport system ATPase component
MSAVLRTQGVSVSFGGVRAVVGVDLEVGEGKLVGLIGPNGAGKTTFIDAITGFVRCTGRVQLDGHELTGLRPHARSRLGLARTWQSIDLFDDLSVRENLRVAGHHPSVWRMLKESVSTPRLDDDEVATVLELLGLEPVADELPSDLSQGQRARRIARARREAALVLSTAGGRSRHGRAPSWDGGCGGSRTPDSRCSSSTTTWGSCSGSATRSSCSSSAR